MPWTIPAETKHSYRLRSRGIVVWAIQRGLTDVGHRVVKDGIYGRRTEAAVATFQEEADLEADGIFGPASSTKMARALEKQVPQKLPTGLLHGLVSGESGDLIGAVNWAVAGGVDCGYCQRRVYNNDASDPVIERAFNGLYQMSLLGESLDFWHTRYYPMVKFDAITRGHEDAWRLATLRHNYPYGADKIAQVGYAGLSDYWTTPQQWVMNIGARFPDGQRVESPLDWCKHYSLGALAHDEPGMMCRFVTDWTP